MAFPLSAVPRRRPRRDPTVDSAAHVFGRICCPGITLDGGARCPRPMSFGILRGRQARTTKGFHSRCPRLRSHGINANLPGGDWQTFTRCPRPWGHREKRSLRPVCNGHRDPSTASTILARIAARGIFRRIARWDPRVQAHELLRDLLGRPYDRETRRLST